MNGFAIPALFLTILMIPAELIAPLTIVQLEKCCLGTCDYVFFKPDTVYFQKYYNCSD